MSGKRRKIEIKTDQAMNMADEEKKVSEDAAPEGEAGERPSAEGSAERGGGPSTAEAWRPPPRDADFSLLDEEPRGSETASKQELDEYKDKYLRALAELENFKKRALKERSEMLKYQGDRILYDMLEIMDNFDRALLHAEADPAQLRSGIEMIHRMFEDTLGKWQVRGESALGQIFDPVKHHALGKVPVDDMQPGTVINELKKAYYYKDKLLRPGEVVVADRRPDEGENSAAQAEEVEPPENTEEEDGGEDGSKGA